MHRVDLLHNYYKMLGDSSLRKVFALFLVPLFILSACGNDEKSKDKEDVSKNDGETQSVEVDKGLLNVEITLPAAFIDEEEENHEKMIADAKADGVKDVIVNDDGSLTYKMSKAKHKEMLAEMETGLLETIDEIKDGEDFVSIKDVKYNKSFSEFTLVVDQEMFENSFDSFASMGIGMSAMFYQLFTGAGVDDLKVTIDIKDEESGEVIETVVYPDEFDE